MRRVLPVLCGFIVLCLLIVICPNGTAFALNANADFQLEEAKVYCQATLEDDFDDSCVLVVLDKKTGEINNIT